MTDSHEMPRMILAHGSADDMVITPYVTASSAVADPYVRQRIVPQGHCSGSEVITEFAPAPSRPVSYPAGLPFVPGREVFTTESATPGARWLCTDPHELLATVVSTSESEGWRVIPMPPREKLLAAPNVVLERGAVWREVQIFPSGERSLLQLWDLPVGLFDPKPA